VPDPLFAPRGIAVAGASPKAANIGGRVLEALWLHQFAGAIAAVNPGHSEIAGTPCFPSLRDVPFAVDLVLVFVGAKRVADLVSEAADIGAGAAVVYSSGFAETGADGQREQERLRRIARERGIRVIGPNCQGLVDFRSGLAATFSPAVLGADRDRLAPVAYVGQSGAVGGVFFDLARQRGVTPTAWVSTGNEVDLTVTEAATRLIDAGPLELLCLYLEQVPDGAEWLALAERARAAGTRLAVLRSGRSDSGRRAAASHTGSLVGDDVPFELACEMHGVITAGDIADLVELAVARRAGAGERGPRVGVVTTSGGAGSLAADQLEARGLRVPVLSPRTQTRLRELLPAFGAAENPVDVTADLMMREPEDLARVCAIVAEDEAVDQVLLAVTNLVGPMADHVAATLVPPPGVPLTMAYLAAPDRTVAPIQALTERGVAVHPGIRAAVTAMAALTVRPSTQRVAPPGSASRALHAGESRTSDRRVAHSASASRALRVGELRDQGPKLPAGAALTEWSATPLLDWAGVHRPDAELVTDPATLPAAVERLGGNAVLKVQSPQVLHKSEFGAVAVGVDAAHAEHTAAEMLASVRAALPDAEIEGVLAQRMCGPGVELLIGARAGTGGYPPTITVGIGGTTVELYGDVATAFAPLDAGSARRLLEGLRGFPLLDGYRGRTPCDVPAAAAAVAALSRAITLPGLVEVEVNPLIVHAAGSGATAVDLLVRKETT
jgi:acyl-CoA synthetase (NDP forming)